MKGRLITLSIKLGLGTALLPTVLTSQVAQQPPRDSIAPMPSIALPPSLDRVLRDYERAWREGDATALASLFTGDGFVLQNGRPPVRGRAAIAHAYAGSRGPLRLRGLAYSVEDSIAFLIGAYGYESENPTAANAVVRDIGKFTLTLKRAGGGRWLIFSDMDNGNSRPGAAPPDSGAFVVTLGADTVSAESFIRVGDRVDGVIMRRSPRTVVVRYTMTLAPSGLPSRLEFMTRLPDGTQPPNAARSVSARFTPDSVITEIHRDSVVVRRVAVRSAYPEIDGAVSFYAFPIAALRGMGRDSAHFVAYGPGATRGSDTPAARRGANRYWVYSFDSPIEVLTDDAGRVVSIDGSRTTVRIQTRRLPSLDVGALAASFFARERSAGAMGALSPRDSAIAVLGQARISIDYGRPAARGRVIWGPNGVLGDTLWRTGANASTTLTTSADLSIGSGTLPAGTYTLTTLAVPGRYQLFFSIRDTVMLRVPLQARQLDPRVERFTMLIGQTGDRAGTLRLRWDIVELSAPFSVR